MAEQEIITAPARLPVRSDPLAAVRRFADQPAVQRSLPAIGIGGAVLLAGLAWWSFQSPAQRPLFDGMADGDKAAVASALQAGGIAYTLDGASGAISVAEDRYHDARMLLAGQGLPKAAPAGDAMRAALPMGSSRALEGETLRGAREADLARTIEGIDAVKSARVHLATPEPSVFVREQSAPAASVMLTMQQGRSLSEAQVRAIGHLVASAVPGMAEQQVSIVDQAGALLSSEGAGADDGRFRLQVEMEDRYRAAVSALLGPLVGPGNYTAEVHADLDYSESQSTRESYPKDDRALRREEGNRTSNASGDAPAIGIPGALSNTPPPATQLTTTPPPTVAPPATTGGASEETYTRSFDVGREISVTHQPIGRLKRLTVAVALRNGEKPMKPGQVAAIENLVKGAVGFDAARGDTVAITAQNFAKADEVSAEAFWDKPWFMTLLRQGGALIAAVLAFLFVGRPLIKSMRARAEGAAERRSTETQLLAATGHRASTPVTLDMIEAAPSYEARADLVRGFVRQDPARAAVIVRQMMQDSGRG